MQQLSAEAEKALPGEAWPEDSSYGVQFEQILKEFGALHTRLQRLDDTMAHRLEKLEGAESNSVYVWAARRSTFDEGQERPVILRTSVNGSRHDVYFEGDARGNVISREYR